MSRFKQVWLSFWRKDQGIGMIETALLLPIFLMFTFAVMDFGNYLIVKNRIVSANQAIASAIQNNPTMTTGAWGSSTDLEKVIQNSLGNLWFNASGGYIGYTGVSIWTSKTVPTVTSAPGWGSHAVWEQRNIKSPWLSDSDPSNDNNAYYVGVFVWRAVPFLTPLPKLLGLNDVLDEENLAGSAPNGRKVTAAFTVVTLNNASCPADQVLQSTTGGLVTCVPRDDSSCPAGQVLQSTTGGVVTCVPRDNNYLCTDGKILEKIVDGNPVCVHLDLNRYRTRHKNAKYGTDTKTYDCPNEHWVIGFSCTGDCSGRNMMVKCAKIEFETP
jgi:hypothetical protein